MQNNETNAGIYIHVPFCKKACTYCNFHFSTSLQLKDLMLDAIMQEIEMRKSYLENKKIGSIYFGGGTPSLLSAVEIQNILDKILSNFNVAENAELTLEANPDDLSTDKLADLRKAGINRLSIGVQSFNDKDLQWMNRAHNADQSFQSIINAFEAGFDNITIDLIYGLPLQAEVVWKQNLKTAVELNVAHLSCYALTVEPKTKLNKLIEENKIQPVDDLQFEEEFNFMTAFLTEHNFEHYEISNFARDKKYAVHNSSYWKGNWYLGIGPSAHSFNGTSRQWNIANNAAYIKAFEDGVDHFEIEILKNEQQYNEFIMTSLRTSWGLDLNVLKTKFEQYYKLFSRESKRYFDSGHLETINNKVVITQKGKMIADMIISDLFVV